MSRRSPQDEGGSADRTQLTVTGAWLPCRPPARRPERRNINATMHWFRRVAPSGATYLFTDVTASLGHRHSDIDFDDFARQPLQPRKLSQLGPGVAWIDLDQDGWDDLVIGSGRGGRLGVYRNNRAGGFEAIDALPYAAPVSRDQTAPLGWPKSPAEMVVLVGSASYEIGPGRHAGVLQYHAGRPAPDDMLDPHSSSVGPIVLADFDADGNGTEDLFLSQNFFGTEPETGRYDGGRGLWLLGDGHGQWSPLPAQASGIRVYGEQRGAAVADFDRDGRVDLVVTQNGADSRLFRNSGARPGLRVRLMGPPGNPQGIGAVIRVGQNGRYGPAREIHAGSGYWSQDSPIVVMAAPTPPAEVWVRWPGGRVSRKAVSDGAQELLVRFPDPEAISPTR